VTSCPRDPPPCLASAFGLALARGLAVGPVRHARTLDRSLIAAPHRACSRVRGPAGFQEGSPGEQRAARPGHGSSSPRIPERSKASKLHRRRRRTAGGQRIAVTRSRLLGRGKLWRAGIGEEAQRCSQACGPGAQKPDEPHDRLWDATSPRIIRRRKPSRPGGTARTERARRWLRRAEAGETPREWTPGVVDGGEVFENPVEGARLVRAGRLRNASPIRKTLARGEWCELAHIARTRGTTPRRSSVHARTGSHQASPGKANRPGTPRDEVILSLLSGSPTAASWKRSEARTTPRCHAHRAVP
jgi:hypothetical protein